MGNWTFHWVTYWAQFGGDCVPLIHQFGIWCLCVSVCLLVEAKLEMNIRVSCVSVQIFLSVQMIDIRL